ncbi:MAG: SDR family oxidoreductase, partial [Bryobacteraceae bacterium]
PSEDPAAAVVEEIRGAGGTAVAHFGTVATMDGGESIIRSALENYGKLDILVCVAGILRERMIFNMPEEDWDAVIATHLKGHFACMKPATILMRQQRSGRIITFTSSAGLDGSPGQPNYAAAKEGIVGLTRSTAIAMAKYNVTCNAIAPAAQTRMTERTAGAAVRRQRSAGDEVGTAEDIAPVVTFLASDAAGHITGQVIGVNGRQVGLYSQPRQVRKIFGQQRWTPEKLAEVWDSSLGQDELARFKQLGLTPPGGPQGAAIA